MVLSILSHRRSRRIFEIIQRPQLLILRLNSIENTSNLKPTSTKNVNINVSNDVLCESQQKLIVAFKHMLEKRKRESCVNYHIFNKKALQKEQLRIEMDQIDEAVNEFKAATESLQKMGRGTTSGSAKHSLLQWYGPMTDNLIKELNSIKAKERGLNRSDYGDYLLKLPVDKLAVVALNTAFNQVLQTGNSGARITKLVMDIGELIETETNIINTKAHLKEHSEALLRWQKETVNVKLLSNKREAQSLNRKLKKITGDGDEWEPTVKAKVGAALLDILMKSALKENGEPAFVHGYSDYDKKTKKVAGIIRLDPKLYEEMNTVKHGTPRLLPMLVPPKDWDNRAYAGAYLRLKVPLMKTTSRSQKEAVKRADMDDVLVGLNYLGKTAWRINESVLEVIDEARLRNILIGEIPNTHDLPLPDKSTCFSTPQVIQARRDEWKNNPKNAAQVAKAEALKEKLAAENALKSVDTTVSQRKKNKLWKDKQSRPQPAPLDLTSTEPVFDEKLYEEMCRRVAKKNSELHSLRCDMDIKVSVAHKFRKSIMYFPHNLDFRGRAYPIPPNLSHLGSDLCRGLLLFQERRPLGKEGYKWLKIHLCNLYGNNKISLEARQAWTESHVADILDSAERPLEGTRWWTTFESPFQALACCKELKAVMECADPEKFLSNLPVHQDGSCNGLQHYAGLGRDSTGALAVNLIPSNTPQDVYSKVLEKVLEQIELDVQLPQLPDADFNNKETKNNGKYARLVHGKINRKVIKQTVMTSVYGVTRTGARAQVQARLEDKLKEDNPSIIITPEVEKDLFFAAHYVANLTLTSLGQMFGSAKAIMDWLGECSSLVSRQEQTMAWVTPLGLPVIQPYRKSGSNVVKTVLQSLTLSTVSDDLLISARKQRSAFPPNFVHSMDATHMLMTCLKMKNEGKVFASVHDSYWTHACDVSLMNELLRECFVQLYDYPVLDDLKDSLDIRFPDVTFPNIPKRGDLDIQVVRNSRYFFH